MTDKAKERIQRACNHLITLRMRDLETGEWLNIWQCAEDDCYWKIELAPVLEESAT